MQTMRNRRRGVIAGVVAAALLVGACGGDDDEAEAPVTTIGAEADAGSTTVETEPEDVATTAAAQTTVAAEPTEDTVVDTTVPVDSVPATVPATGPADGEYDPAAVLRVGYDLVQQSGGGFTLDPGRASGDAQDLIMYLVYGRLMRPTQDGSLVPDLAESATLVDGTSIEVELREGQTFHDGSPLDAEAVKSALERTLTSGNDGGLSTAFMSLDSIEVTGPLSLRLLIPDGTAAGWYDSFLGSWQTSIVREFTEGEFPVGAGPMKLVDYRPEQSLTYEKFADYWDADSILVGGMEFQHSDLGQPQSGIAAVQSGQIDLVGSEASQMAAVSGNVEMYVQPSESGLVAMHVCKSEGPLADPLVRQALNKGIDRDALGAAVWEGTSVPATQPWGEGSRFYSEEHGDLLGYDPEGAMELLAEAGYPDGFEIGIYTFDALGMPVAAEVIQQQWAAIGVTASVNVGNYVDDFLTPQTVGVGLVTAGSRGIEKLNHWTGDSLANACKYDDPELNDLRSQLSVVSATSDEALEIWQQINDIVIPQALGVFVVFQSRLAAIDTNRIGELQLWPLAATSSPDPFGTYIKADS
jgi:ABC-type transport system substrate-binding protein